MVTSGLKRNACQNQLEFIVILRTTILISIYIQDMSEKRNNLLKI